jgi:putative Holliday junction resolvase
LSRVCEDVEDFLALTGATSSLMGLDFGTKTIGVAISDRLQTVATPRETIKRRKFGLDADAIERLIAENEIVGIVLGLPMNMDGSEGPRAQSTRAFARNLAGRINVPMFFWDERLSTVAAERALLEADMSRKKRAVVIDNVAASYILQGVLDRLSYIRRG